MLAALSGCGKKPDKAEPRASTLTAGKISVGSAIEPETWNPLISELKRYGMSGSSCFAGLVLQNEGEWIPDLARGSADADQRRGSALALTWTYRLETGFEMAGWSADNSAGHPLHL